MSLEIAASFILLAAGIFIVNWRVDMLRKDVDKLFENDEIFENNINCFLEDSSRKYLKRLANSVASRVLNKINKGR